ncbi:hypothetical protein, partial [Heyndrickxia faecalis]|uniref:hypothetical protein n=1 Tax=Heyndrickxia faecalis TaxID=2824910 RepID=UPI003D2122CD
EKLDTYRTLLLVDFFSKKLYYNSVDVPHANERTTYRAVSLSGSVFGETVLYLHETGLHKDACTST